MQQQTIAFHQSAPPAYGTVVYEKNFPSEPSLVPVVVFRVVDYLSDTNLINVAGKTQVMLCLDEAVKNAVNHGNRRNPSCAIDVKIYQGTEKFWISVRDQGGGFSPEKIPNPFDENGLWCEGGRGIHLMHYYADSIEYWESGRTVLLCFRRADVEDEPEEKDETDSQ